MDEALRAVADPTRRAILRLVRDGEVPAGEIAAQFPEISRPAVSQHLRVLSDAGLVEVRPDGNRRLYTWRREGLRDVAGYVAEMWSDSLARLKVAAEREELRERARGAPGQARSDPGASGPGPTSGPGLGDGQANGSIAGTRRIDGEEEDK